MFLHQHETSHIDDLKHYAERYPLVAIGEIGLDFYQKDFDAKQQLHYFETQLTVADQVGLPVLLHVRKAHDETIKLLKRIHRHGGIVHAFNGSIQQAGQYVSMGFKLGFGGMLTYERSNKLRQLAKQLPLDAIVLETDAPDMVVARHRGERNSPEYLIDSLNTLAELRQLPIEEVAKQTTLNAKSVLREIA
jgi:TatD DNase family protein